MTTPGLRRGNEHTHYLRGSCSSSKYVPTDGNDYTSLGGRTGTSAECRLLACLRLCSYCTRVAYEYLYPDHLRGSATVRIGPGLRDWPTRVSWNTWNGQDRDRQNVELAPTAAWGIRPKVQHCLLGGFFAPPMNLETFESSFTILARSTCCPSSEELSSLP